MIINITNTTPPPKDPPTMAPKLDFEFEEAGVGVGVGVGTAATVVDDATEAVEESEIDVKTGEGEAVANAPWPVATYAGEAVASLGYV
jgi:hypothetical protein